VTRSPNVTEVGRCLSDLVLDRVVAFEAAAALEQAETSHLAECARCQARLADFRRVARESAPLVERLMGAAQASVTGGRGSALEMRWLRPAWLGAFGVAMAATECGSVSRTATWCSTWRSPPAIGA
jgi:hypothetical protein